MSQVLGKWVTVSVKYSLDQSSVTDTFECEIRNVPVTVD